MTFLTQGMADGTAKNMMGQTNIFKAKLKTDTNPYL